MREHKCCFLHNNRPAVLLMQPCITIGCQLISPLSKYLKALVLTKKVSTLFERTRSLVTFLKNAQNSLSQPDISSPGTISSRGYLSKLDVSEGPCTCKYISFLLCFFLLLWSRPLVWLGDRGCGCPSPPSQSPATRYWRIVPSLKYNYTFTMEK